MVQIKLDQTTLGKAYEYACLQSIAESVQNIRDVVIVSNSSLNIARNAWDLLDDDQKENMKLSSMAGVISLLQLEPKIIEDGRDSLELSLQADQGGQEGDVRDVLIIRRQIDWEIGISVKHNHSAVKHSRLSPTINFGKDWLGLNSGVQYFEEIRPIFNMLQSLKDKGAKWS